MRGVKLVPRKKKEITPLKAQTGVRPKCHKCGNELTPRTEWFFMKGLLLVPPTMAEAKVSAASRFFGTESSYYRPERVFRLQHVGPSMMGDTTRVSFWTERYEGRGKEPSTGLPIFCSVRCAASFGVKLYIHGVRLIEGKLTIKKEGE
jgi:hypothetical protein